MKDFEPAWKTYGWGDDDAPEIEENCCEVCGGETDFRDGFICWCDCGAAYFDGKRSPQNDEFHSTCSRCNTNYEVDNYGDIACCDCGIDARDDITLTWLPDTVLIERGTLHAINYRLNFGSTICPGPNTLPALWWSDFSGKYTVSPNEIPAETHRPTIEQYEG